MQYEKIDLAFILDTWFCICTGDFNWKNDLKGVFYEVCRIVSEYELPMVLQEQVEAENINMLLFH